MTTTSRSQTGPPGATGGLPASALGERCTGSRQAAHGTRRVGRAFSLAELMIAMVILGLGLLFIAAALPVGLEYTRRTVAQANGDAAGDYALSLLEANLRTSVHLYDRSLADPTGANMVHRLDNVFRPRDMVIGPPPIRYELQLTHEPVIKVRPLALGNIGLAQVLGSDPSQRGAELVDYAELAISTYLSTVLGISLPVQLVRREFEFPYDNSGVFNDLVSLVRNPVLPGIARVFPPVEPVTTFTVAGFFDTSDNIYPTYAMRGGLNNPLLSLPAQFRERQKAIERRVAWTALYRRVSYRSAQEALRYELIVVVTQRISGNHRFPQQDLTVANPFQQPLALPSGTTAPLIGTDRLAPVPWLVTFDWTQPLPPTPALDLGTDYDRINWNTENEERVILNTYNDPPTLTFRCRREVGVLLPVGSVLIPAVNDQRYLPPAQGGLWQHVGFVPSARESLPIYEVVEVIEPDDPDESWTIMVKNNGFYPWLNPDVPGLDARHFPVWVIPPAFVERGSNGQPVYERASPILKVVRRTVTLREINR